MNEQNKQQRPKVTVQIDPEWVRIIKTAKQIKYGELTIKIHQERIELTEYVVKKKPTDEDTELPQVVEL